MKKFLSLNNFLKVSVLVSLIDDSKLLFESQRKHTLNVATRQ